MHFHELKKSYIWIQIALKFVCKGPSDNKLAMYHVMAWHQKGTKPLSDPMMTDIYGAICHDEATVS